jgi:hypothetical protein
MSIEKPREAVFEAEANIEVPFYIPATGPETRPRRTLKHVACSPQAWASATPFSLLQAALGLELDPTAQEVRLRSPRLPKFLDEVIVRNLHVGDSALTQQPGYLCTSTISTPSRSGSISAGLPPSPDDLRQHQSFPLTAGSVANVL